MDFKTEPEPFKGSTQAIRQSLGLFDLWPTDISVVESSFLQSYPITTYKDDNLLPIEFVIPKSHQHYISCNESYIMGECRIVKQDGTKLLEIDQATVGQQFSAQIFDSVNVYLNSVNITHSPQLYPYKAACEQLLSNSPANQASFLSQGLFFRDSKADVFDITKNLNYKNRIDLTKLSTPFEFVCPIYDSIFQQIRMLVPLVEIRIKIMRSSPLQCLVSGNTHSTENPSPYKLVFDNIVLMVKRYVVDPAIMKHHEKLLQSNRFQYPVFDTCVKSFTVAKDSTNFVETLFYGKIPQRLVILMQDEKSASGSLSKDRLCFKPHSLGMATLTLDGEQKHSEVMKFNPTHNNYLAAYHSFLEACQNPELGVGTDRKEFTDNCFMLVFQLDAPTVNRFSRQKYGQLKLELVFSKPLSSAIQIFALGKFQNLIQVDNNFNIYVENSII
jgi:hypothetical protein